MVKKIQVTLYIADKDCKGVGKNMGYHQGGMGSMAYGGNVYDKPQGSQNVALSSAAGCHLGSSEMITNANYSRAFLQAREQQVKKVNGDLK